MRRQRVYGMRQSDIFILEHLYNGGDELICTPKHLSTNIGFSLSLLQKRMPQLREVGLVQYHDKQAGEYRIDELGRKYVTGSLSKREVAEIERDLAQF